MSIADFSKEIQLDPNDAIAYLYRGIAYTEAEEYDKAISDFTKSINLNPFDMEAYLYRGNSHYFKEDYNNAISDYNKAIKLDPYSISLLYARSFAYKEMRKQSEAISDIDQCLSLLDLMRIKDKELKIILEAAKENKCKSPLKLLWKNLHTPPDLPDIVYSYNGDKRDYDKVIVDNNKIIELNPDDAVALCNRGFAYYEKKVYLKGIADFNKIIEMYPYNVDPFFFIAAFYNDKSKQYYGKDAILNYSAIICLDNKNWLAYLGRGYTYNAMGQYDKSFSDYTQLIKFFNKSDTNIKIDTLFKKHLASRCKSQTNAFLSRAYAFENAGKWKMAIGDYKKAIELNPGLEKGKNYLERTRRQQDDFKNVIFKDTHNGYDFMIKYNSNAHSTKDSIDKYWYQSFIKIPGNHRCYEKHHSTHSIINNNDIYINYSKYDDDDWWIGWSSNRYNYKYYELIDLIKNCCRVIMDLSS